MEGHVQHFKVSLPWLTHHLDNRVDGKHVVKRRGQYVQYMERDNGDFLRLARLDQIMTHEAVAGKCKAVYQARLTQMLTCLAHRTTNSSLDNGIACSRLDRDD